MNKYYVYEDNVNGEIYYYGEEWESVRPGKLVEFDTMKQANEYIASGIRHYDKLEEENFQKYREEQERIGAPVVRARFD